MLHISDNATHTSVLCAAEGPDGLCSDGLWQDSGVCCSNASSPPGASHWRNPWPRCYSDQRARRTGN